MIYLKAAVVFTGINNEVASNARPSLNMLIESSRGYGKANRNVGGYVCGWLVL
jgi:hypothetical protein